jgi:hypothetical protein
LVVRRRWIDEAGYADLVALCQFLPGPASSQVGFALGLLRGGPLGALAAWCAFTLPSALIIAWKLCTTMRADDVTQTLNLALKASGCDRAEVVHKPKLLSDNGSSDIAGDLADWLIDQGMVHIRGAPNHPQTQGKIERWHQTLKTRILLENY